jgi:hypothetical protein
MEMKFIECLDVSLRRYSFKRLERLNDSSDPVIIAAWRRNILRTNRGVAVAPVVNGISHIEEFARSIAKPIGKKIGYIKFFTPLGLQLIVTGKSILGATDGLGAYLSHTNNTDVVLQSIHVVDYDQLDWVSVRTWGQHATSRYQDAIEKGIAVFLETARMDRTES